MNVYAFLLNMAPEGRAVLKQFLSLPLPDRILIEEAFREGEPAKPAEASQAEESPCKPANACRSWSKEDHRKLVETLGRCGGGPDVYAALAAELERTPAGIRARAKVFGLGEYEGTLPLKIKDDKTLLVASRQTELNKKDFCAFWATRYQVEPWAIEQAVVRAAFHEANEAPLLASQGA